jgi:hypothetical protein
MSLEKPQTFGPVTERTFRLDPLDDNKSHWPLVML